MQIEVQEPKKTQNIQNINQTSILKTHNIMHKQTTSSS